MSKLIKPLSELEFYKADLSYLVECLDELPGKVGPRVLDEKLYVLKQNTIYASLEYSYLLSSALYEKPTYPLFLNEVSELSEDKQLGQAFHKVLRDVRGYVRRIATNPKAYNKLFDLEMLISRHTSINPPEQEFMRSCRCCRRTPHLYDDFILVLAGTVQLKLTAIPSLNFTKEPLCHRRQYTCTTNRYAVVEAVVEANTVIRISADASYEARISGPRRSYIFIRPTKSLQIPLCSNKIVTLTES